MTARKVRGLEDREAQERKALLRDVRSPVHQLLDALKNGTVQTCCVFGAGVCLLAFPTAATPFFGLGVFFFLLRCLCVRNERLPFRMPLGLSGTDKGDPLPGRRGFANRRAFFSWATVCKTARNFGSRPRTCSPTRCFSEPPAPAKRKHWCRSPTMLWPLAVVYFTLTPNRHPNCPCKCGN